MTQEVKHLHNDSDGRHYECPLCGAEIVVRDSVFYGRCNSCGMTLMDYKPAEHQMAFHESSSKYRLNLGGYGAGKTTMSCAEIAHHMMTVPNGKTLITSQILSQVSEAVLPELHKFLPPWLIRAGSIKKSPSYTLELINGHSLIVFASDDSEKLRSLNLSAFYVEEASGIDVKIFHELQMRLRSPEAYKVDDKGNIIEDNLLGIISSNPEQGWLVDEFLLLSNEIHTSSHVDASEYKAMQFTKTKGYASFLSSTRDNNMLPPDFVSLGTAGKTQEWIDKYIDCKISSREGAVYPMFSQHIVEDFPVPKDWKRVVGYDAGFNDPTAVLYGAIDPKTGVVYFYDEYYVKERTIDQNAKALAPIWKELDFYKTPVGDPAIKKRNETTGKSHQAMFFKASGIFIRTGNNNIDDGVDRTRLMMNTGRFKFFTSLINLKKEMSRYVYGNSKNKEKPADGEDHLVDTLRYIAMDLEDETNLEEDFGSYTTDEGGYAKEDVDLLDSEYGMCYTT